MTCLEVFLGFFVALTAVSAHPNSSLEIQPNSRVISKQIGTSLALTCKPNVDDTKLISQLEWRDTKNRRIENTNRANPIFVRNITHEPGLVLIFQKLEENDAGNYTCAANYASQELRSSVVVSTFVDITFVDAPESQFPKAGEDYVVKCKVQGNPTPMVDWNKDGQTIDSNDRYVVQTEGLLIQNVRESDDGLYKCTAVVLSTGQFKMRNIKVEVIIPPKISPLAKVEIIEGETAWVKCNATGKPPPSYQWIKQRTSQDLSKTDRFDVKKTTGDLIINRIEFNDDDTYKCVAVNPAGQAEMQVKIDVLVKPKIYELMNVTAPVGAKTKLVCKVQGRPTPKVTFRKLSSKYPMTPGEQEKGRIVLEPLEKDGETYATLEISKLNRSDDGLYECIAENSAGTSYKNGHITVEFPPTFDRTGKFHQTGYAWQGHPGNLTCIPEAIPNATIIWKYNELIINPNNNNFKQIGSGPISHLIVYPGKEARLYTNYECVASNKLGIAAIKIALREAHVPEMITQIRANSITATTIKFDIQPPPHFDTLPIRSFTVRYRNEREMGQNWNLARNHTWSFEAPYILENLVPETTYQFQFSARNDVGDGPWRDFQTITMPRRSEPAEPKIYVPDHSTIQDENSSQREVIAVSPYADHFELRWHIPNDNGDPIDYYLIRYCEVQKTNGRWLDEDCSEEFKQSVQYTSYELNDLAPDTVYKMELRAHNSIGESSPAQILVKTARGIDPAVPYNEASVSNLAIIGIVVGAVVLVLLLVDLICFCVNRAGILAFICDRSRAKHHEEDPKLGRDEREPLKPDNTTINGERSMSVEFDGKHVYSKSGEIIGKHSAV